VDVAFVLDEPFGERARPADLAVETLIAEEVTVIAPTSHALASAPTVLPQGLRGETVLLPEAPESGCAYRGQFERQLGSAGVAAGMGVSVLPSVAVGAELKAGMLAALQWGEPFEVLTQMSWHEDRWKSPALRAFLEVAREVFSSTPASTR
jgi:DNA-binding transcriptional LysR family regulator